MEAVVVQKPTNDQRRVLITGGAGFIGSHLAEFLLRQGHTVTAIDNLVTGRAENLAHLGGDENFELIVDTVLNEELVNRLIARHDLVIHLAAAVGVRWIIDNPLLSIHTNIRATEIVLDAAARVGKKVVVASTSEVYGKNSKPLLSEDDDCVIGSTRVTRWLYANTKATDEFLAFAYHRDKGLPVVIVRFFNTVGPRQTGRYGMVVPSFVQQALANQPLTVFGDGTQTRCFTDVRDTVRAVYELAVNPAADGHVFNVGNAREISIRSLAHLIIRMTDSRSQVKLVPYEKAYPEGFEDMRRRVPSTAKLREFLGWEPAIPLEENLIRIIESTRAGAFASME